MVIGPEETGEGELKLSLVEKAIADEIEGALDEKLKIAEKGKEEYKLSVSKDNLPEIVRAEIEKRYGKKWEAKMTKDARYQGDDGPVTYTVLLRRKSK